MMLFLPRNVISYGVEMRRAYGKGSIAFLPGEAFDADFFMNPSGRHGFCFPQQIGNPMSGFQTDQQMHMIGNAADFFGNAFEVFDDSSQKGMEPWPP